MQDREFRKFQGFAKRKGMTLAEWVRQTLRKAGDEEPTGSVEKKLSAVRAAARHSFPAPDIETMLSEIESGYGPKRRK